MIRRVILGALVTAASSIFLFAATGHALADSPGRLVARGNGSLKGGDYDRAVEYYEKASVRAPESPVIAFNMGNAYYRKEEFSKARGYFEDATLKSRDLELEAKAWYNMGNCAFREAGRQVDSDMEKALEYYQECVRFYGTALEKDPELTDAAHNMEVARLVIKDLLDRIKKQQEEQKEQQEMMKEVVDSLVALIERQRDVMKQGEKLEGEKTAKTGAWNEKVKGLETKQGGIEKGTGDVRDRLGELFPGEQPPPQVKDASSHLDTSLVNQEDAVEDLSGKDPGEAAEDQGLALEQLEKALEALAEGQNPPQDQSGEEEQQSQQKEQPQQDQQDAPDESGKQGEKKPRDETASGILDEEKENKKKRQKQARQSYRPVEKDW